ncbi:MAG: AMP-binding protein [Thermodesulfobacteriota bacterium]
MKSAETISAILDQQARKYGDRTYLFFEDQKVTYGELAQRGTRLACGLRASGVSAGDKVAVLLTNSPSFFDVFFGVALTGATLVPINPRYKFREVKDIIDRVEAETLIIEKELWGDLKGLQEGCKLIKNIFFKGSDTPPGLRPFTNLYSDKNVALPGIKFEDEFAIIFTSGTTGAPKGVVLTHGNYVTNAFQGARGKDFNESTRVLTCLPLVHVNAQVSSFLGSFVMGGQLVLQKEFHPKEFLVALSKYSVTSFAAVPTIYAILLNQADLNQYDFSHLTYCISGSAPMSRALRSNFEKTFNANILEAYGLTEATAMVSTNPPHGIRKVGSIGLPYENIKMKVVDFEDHTLDSNQVGEILISGPNVFKGYFKEPEATAKAVVNGWLHSGDLGYRDDDGYYFLTGRIKELIIRGGINIYPKEIEDIIATYSKIAQVAIIGIPDEIWGERVHACIISKENQRVTVEEINNYLKDKIASFKIPNTLSLHREFPMGGLGKIKKQKLKEVVMQVGGCNEF